ncbi:MAG: HAD-IIB family hydrolase [Nanoarchaeota archaeon]
MLLATDLDRTLLPNGKQGYDGSLYLFKKIANKKNIKIVYVTGRNLFLIKQATRKFNAPYPDNVIVNVGTRIYEFKNKKFIEDKEWIKKIKKNTKNWNIKKFKQSLKKFKGLKLQENSKQDNFKLSYYINEDFNEKEVEILIKKIEKEIFKICKNVRIIYSVDYPCPRGLLDIVPKKATKFHAVEYLVNKSKIPEKEVVCCGDSGNDISFLNSRYKSILVKNSRNYVKKQIKKNKKKNSKKIYIARGNKFFFKEKGSLKRKKLNGNYVSGIIEGLVYYGFINKKELIKL